MCVALKPAGKVWAGTHGGLWLGLSVSVREESTLFCYSTPWDFHVSTVTHERMICTRGKMPVASRVVTVAKPEGNIVFHRENWPKFKRFVIGWVNKFSTPNMSNYSKPLGNELSSNVFFSSFSFQSPPSVGVEHKWKSNENWIRQPLCRSRFLFFLLLFSIVKDFWCLNRRERVLLVDWCRCHFHP